MIINYKVESNEALKHIAIIMDGNGRWAKQRLLPKIIGHKNGVKSVEKIIESAQKLGIQYLTLYAFSSENWSRPQDEVNDLMSLFKHYLTTKAHKIIENGIRIIFIGNRSKISIDIVLLMEEIEEASKINQFTLIIAFSYGGRDEIREAALHMSHFLISQKHNQNDIKNIEPNFFDQFINIHNIPDPDLLIRTGGDFRISNFLLWQLAYTELYFTNKLWPDFGHDDLLSAIYEFNSRERRYGK